MARECSKTCGLCTTVCSDHHESCPGWAVGNECDTNKEFMINMVSGLPSSQMLVLLLPLNCMALESQCLMSVVLLVGDSARRVAVSARIWRATKMSSKQAALQKFQAFKFHDAEEVVVCVFYRTTLQRVASMISWRPNPSSRRNTS